MKQEKDVNEAGNGVAAGSTDGLDGVKWGRCDGRRAKSISFPNGDQCTSTEEHEIICVVDYRGDRDEIWMVQLRNGKEWARHNTRHIESIVWIEPT